jgi:hypothetical protein
MRSPIQALTWEIWRRGRHFGCLTLGCISFGSLMNLLGPEGFRASSPIQGLCWFLMVWSFLFLFSFFNCTEINSTREWNGFPYRLFALPVRTWKLVTLPIFLGVVSVELLYLAWLKLVWTHANIPSPGWFGVLLGAYMVFYQTALWGLAGVRMVRLLVLSVGGASSILVACLPLVKDALPPWFSEAHMTAAMVTLALVSFLIAWGTVAHQRYGGGRRQNRLKVLVERVSDALPRRAKDFASPAAAQFWFEWRRAGWLLPVCVAFILAFLVTPILWINWDNPGYMSYMQDKFILMPIILAFVIGKGYIKPEFWTTNLSLPSFLATRPLGTGEFVICKMKVAALSAVITWLLVLGYIVVWLLLCPATKPIRGTLNMIRMLYPHSWLIILFLLAAVLMVFTWRCMVSGLWVGLSGRPLYYVGAFWLQVMGTVVLTIVWGVSGDTIDWQINHHPDVVKSLVVSVIGWTLAVLVVLKMWFAVFSWSKITPRRSRQYLLIWSSVTLCFVLLGVLFAPFMDTYRIEHLSILAALFLVPFARLGLAPSALAMNRHR